MVLTRKLKIALCVLVWVTGWPASARADVTLDRSFHELDVSDFWQYQQSPSFDFADSPPQEGYRPVTPRPANFDEFGNAYWFRLSVTNASDQHLTRLLEMVHQNIRLARLFVAVDGEFTAIQEDGLLVANQATDIPTDHPLFTIDIPAGKSVDLYLAVSSLDSMPWHTKLWTPKAYARNLTHKRTLLGFLLGIIAVMGLFNLIVASISKQKAFGHLGVFLIALLALQLILQGLGSVYLWPDDPTMKRHVLGPTFMVFGLSMLIFSQTFLEAEIKGFNLRLRQTAVVFTVLAIVPVSLSGNGLFILIAALSYIFPILAIAGWAVVQAFHGYRPAKHYLLVFSPLLFVLACILANRSLALGWDLETVQLLLLTGSAMVSLTTAAALAGRIRSLAANQLEAEHASTVAQFQAEQANLKAAAAEQTSKAKSDFLATMSHEIRTPMNGVLGMADLIGQTNLDHQQTAFVETLRRSGQALMSILNDILDFSKVEAGHLSLEIVDVDLLELLDDVTVLFKERINQNHLQLYTWINPDVPGVIKTDPTRLRQILSNLLSNAIKFSDGGVIHIHVSTTEDPHRAGEMLEVRVSDQGVGMNEEAMDLLFDRFSQADSSISRRFGGTGLGLAICKSLVELMGGHIRAESEPDIGTSMIFTIDAPSCESMAVALLKPALHYVGDDANLAEMLRLWSKREAGHFKRITADKLAMLSAQDIVFTDTDEVLHTQARVIRPGRDIGTPIGLVRLHELIANLPNNDSVNSESLHPLNRHTSSTPHTDANHAIAQDKPVDAAQPLSGVSILVAEDNAVNRMVVGKMLTGFGADVRFAHNGLEALSCFEANQSELDVILMDCEMPEMDGYAATSAIRDHETDASRIPIIAITAHVLDEYRERAMQAGMTDYITKPIDRETLLNAIQTCC